MVAVRYRYIYIYIDYDLEMVSRWLGLKVHGEEIRKYLSSNFRLVDVKGIYWPDIVGSSLFNTFKGAYGYVKELDKKFKDSHIADNHRDYVIWIIVLIFL